MRGKKQVPGSGPDLLPVPGDKGQVGSCQAGQLCVGLPSKNTTPRLSFSDTWLVLSHQHPPWNSQQRKVRQEGRCWQVSGIGMHSPPFSQPLPISL